MEQNCINWFIIAQNIISGSVIAFLGYLFWKRQYKYSKKREIYLILKSKITNLYAHYQTYENHPTEERYNEIKQNFLTVLDLLPTYMFYYGSKYEFITNIVVNDYGYWEQNRKNPAFATGKLSTILFTIERAIEKNKRIKDRFIIIKSKFYKTKLGKLFIKKK
ncbi:hypothetical protein DSECCO2_288160 [anaerobic digester metagenome]